MLLMSKAGCALGRATVELLLLTMRAGFSLAAFPPRSPGQRQESSVSAKLPHVACTPTSVQESNKAQIIG